MKRYLLAFGILVLTSTQLFGGIMDDYKKGRELRDSAKQNDAGAMQKIIPYLGDQKPILRDSVFEGIRLNVTDGGAIKALAQALLTHKNVMVRENIAEVLGYIGKDQKDLIGKVLIKSLTRDPAPSVRVEAARALGRLKVEEGGKYLEKAFNSSSRNWLLRGEALDALVEIKGNDASNFIKKALKDRDHLIQAYGLRLLAKQDPHGALDDAIAILSKVKPKKIALKGWQPAFVAFQVVVKAARKSGVNVEKLKNAITIIIELLKGLEGRLFYNAVQALEGATDERGIIPSYRDWNDWWKANKNRFQPPSGANEESKEGKRLGTVLKYHGIPLYSNRIVFMVDHSGSMKNRLGEGDSKSKIKFDVCKEELIKTVQGLNKKVFFNIVFLETDLFSWKKRLTQAVPFNQRAAIQYVSKASSTKAIGSSYRMRGNFFDAIFKALNDPYADTIFLLSDGGPTAGKYAFPSRVKTKVTEINKFLNFEIHTILIGASKAKDQKFMEALAKVNNGKAHVKAGKRFDGTDDNSSKKKRKRKKSNS